MKRIKTLLHKSSFYLFTFSAMLLTLGIATSGGPAAADNASTTTIHPGDHVKLTVYNHQDLSVEDLATNSNGTAAVPLAGNIKLSGLTEQQAAQNIEHALLPYLRFPAVNVRVVSQGKTIFFTGAYNGIADFAPGETLGAAIGNLTQRPALPQSTNVFNPASVNMHNVRLERDGVVLPDAYDIEQLSRTGDSGPPLEPGDIIRLSTKPVKVDVRGNARTTGPVYVDQGDSLAQALAQSGGLADSASFSHIILKRRDTTQVITSGSTEMLAPAQDGDVLILQPALHVSVVGNVLKPGDIVLQSNTSLYNALYQAGGPAPHTDMAHIRVLRNGSVTNHDLSRVKNGDPSANVQLTDGDTVIVSRGRGMDGTSAAIGASILGSMRILSTGL